MKKQIYRKNHLNFIFLLLSSFAEAGFMIVLSIMLEKVLAIASSKNESELIQQGIIFLILLVVSVSLYLFNLYVKPTYKRRAMSQYKKNIYSKILEKNIDGFSRYETSTYISALTNDVNYIEENYIFSIFQIILQIVLFVAAITIMFIYNWILTLVAIGFSLLPLVVALLVGGKLMKVEEKISEENSSFMHFVKDNLIGFSTIKVFQAESKIKELFTKNNNKLETAKAKSVRINTPMELLQSMTQVLAQFGVFFVGAYICIKNENFEASVLILFVQLMNYIISPLATVPTLISKRNAAIPLFKRIENILNDKVEEEKNEINFEKEITLTNMSFSYDDKTILNDINICFEKDKSYAVVGTSGSGKTTLLNVLSGRVSNYEGSIKYDETELKDSSLTSLYSQLSYVEQNVFVFDDTIKNNITMYSEVDENKLETIIKKSGLENLIKEKGIDYVCGENGCNLSGGEKQRISIARALLKDSKIILLDESTSALDKETATSIMNNILDLDNITKLVITHNLDSNILTKFDEIIVISDGNIIERGTFQSLIDKAGILYSLYNIEKIKK